MDDQSPGIGKARNTARKLLKDAKIDKFPVLLKEVVKPIPDLYIDGKELMDGISGMQGTYKGRSFIRYNSGHSTKRNRFTVAHEIGHLLLGHTSICNRSTSLDPQEIEANEFAAELLMPLQMLKKEIEVQGSVSALSKACWVSEEAMSKRIMKTSLYKKLSSW